jgi:hypothetical protein
VTTAKRLFGIIKAAFTFSVGAKFFDALGIRYLLLPSKSGIALSHLVHDHLKLRHWVGVIEEAAVCMRAHCTSTKQRRAVSTKQMNGAIFFCVNNSVVVF